MLLETPCIFIHVGPKCIHPYTLKEKETNENKVSNNVQHTTDLLFSIVFLYESEGLNIPTVEADSIWDPSLYNGKNQQLFFYEAISNI